DDGQEDLLDGAEMFAADDDLVDVHQVDHGQQRGGQLPGGPGEDVGQRLGAAGRGDDGVDAAEVAVAGGIGQDRGRGGLRFQAAGSAAVARPTARVDHDVADLHRVAGHPQVGLVVDDQAAPDPHAP